MSRREGSLFVGRLSKNSRTRDVEEIFELYGRVQRCEVKYGAEMAYAFVDFEDRRDAEDALRYENGRDLMGSAIVVEWAKGNPRRPSMASSRGDDLCYKCNRAGHWARDCPDERGYGGGGGGRRGGGGGGGSRYDRRSRSRSPRRRRSRSRSRDRSSRKKRRSPSRSRSRSRSPVRSRSSRKRSASRSPSKSPRLRDDNGGQSD